MSTVIFTLPFYQLAKKWASGISISIDGLSQPRYETQNFSVTTQFAIKASTSTETLGGRYRVSHSSRQSMNNRVNQLLHSAKNGHEDHLNNILHNKLKKYSLLSLIKDSTALDDYSYSCHISCNGCNGSGKNYCGACNGRGQVEVPYQEISHYERTYNGQIPIYRTMIRYDPCYRCGSSGRVNCGTCGGHGENTLVKKISFYAQAYKTRRNWNSFSELAWVDDSIKENDYFDIDSAVVWDHSQQSITRENNEYVSTLPGRLQAGECWLSASSKYHDKTSGLCKTFGEQVFDTDFIFDRHFRWQGAYDAKASLALNSVGAYSSSLAASACSGDLRSSTVPSGELSGLNIISGRTAITLRNLISRLYHKHQQERQNLSVFKVIGFSMLAAILQAGILLITLNKYNPAALFSPEFGFLPMLYNAYTAITYAVSTWWGQMDGQLNHGLLLGLIALFLVTTAMRYIFGANTITSNLRLNKWFVFSGVALVAYAMQFMPSFPTPSLFQSNHPAFDFALFSLFVGVLWAKKNSYGINKKAAEQYQSDRLMTLLGYKE